MHTFIQNIRQHNFSVPEILLGLIMLASMFSYYELDWVLPGSPRPEHVMMLALLPVIVFYYLVIEKEWPFRLDTFTLLAGAWLVINLLASVLNAPELRTSLTHIARFVLLVGLTVITAHVTSEPQRWWRMVRLWIFIVLVEATFGVISGFLGTFTAFRLGNRVWSDVPLPRVYGTLHEPNPFGMVVGSVFVTLVFIWFYQRKHNIPIFLKDNRWLVGILLICVAALEFSYSRSAWLGCALGLGLSIVWISDHFKQSVYHGLELLAMALVVGLVITATLSFYTPPQETLSQNPHSTNSLLDRVTSFFSTERDEATSWRITNYSLALEEDFPRQPVIGHGTGSFPQLHQDLDEDSNWLSSFALGTLVDTGLLGLLIVNGWIVWTVVVALKGVIKLPLQTPVRPGLLGLIMAFGASMVAVQFTGSSWLAPFWIHLGLLGGGIYASHKVAAEQFASQDATE